MLIVYFIFYTQITKAYQMLLSGSSLRSFQVNFALRPTSTFYHRKKFSTQIYRDDIVIMKSFHKTRNVPPCHEMIAEFINLLTCSYPLNTKLLCDLLFCFIISEIFERLDRPNTFDPETQICAGGLNQIGDSCYVSIFLVPENV